MEWTPIFRSKADEFTRGDRWQLKFDDTIVPDRPNSGWAQCMRKTSARFSCTKCRRSWPSNHVMVVFHLRLNKKTHRGTVKVRPFRQNCKRCQDAPFEDPRIKDKNIEILMENLVKSIRKKCYHEDLGDGHRPHIGVEVRSPHEPDHCEGCKAGICDRDRDLSNSFRNLNI